MHYFGTELQIVCETLPINFIFFKDGNYQYNGHRWNFWTLQNLLRKAKALNKVTSGSSSFGMKQDGLY